MCALEDRDLLQELTLSSAINPSATWKKVSEYVRTLVTNKSCGARYNLSKSDWKIVCDACFVFSHEMCLRKLSKAFSILALMDIFTESDLDG